MSLQPPWYLHSGSCQQRDQGGTSTINALSPDRSEAVEINTLLPAVPREMFL